MLKLFTRLLGGQPWQPTKEKSNSKQWESTSDTDDESVATSSEPEYTPPELHSPAGFRVASATCGIKPSGKPDMMLVVADGPASVAAVFTQNKFAAAPVIRGRNLIRNTSGRLRGLLVNSGNANAATGEQGRKDCAASAQLVSEALKVHHSEFGAISPEAFITSSTGVIGVQLPMDKIGQGIDVCVKHLGSDAEDWMGAARGIMTTDTVPKVASTKVEMELKGEQMSCSIIGMAKGAGMIHPNMATLLVYFFTDAAISPSLLSKIFKPSIDDSFNSMTIDGDTSTNDTALIMASGDSNFKIEDSPGSNTPKSRFQNELTKLAIDLAHQVIRDQEGGCRTLCTIKVKGTPTDADAHKLARCVATSLLFRSALHGADPNWGRIAMAMGNAGVEFSISDVNMTLGEVKLMEAGQPLDFDEKTASDSLMSPDVTLAIEVGGGSGKGHYYCGDLSEDYITFNADYTT